MNQQTTAYRLDPDRAARAKALVDGASRFLEAQGYPLGQALVEHHWREGAAAAVLDALGAFQNADGGFGQGLEVDIAAPVSNPFAARLAMHVLLSLRERPAGPLVDGLGAWLQREQHEDGDWHFVPAVYGASLPPWFASWTFPSLNPACCLTGLAISLGLDTPVMRERTGRLFAKRAMLEEARAGDYYGLLPYVEYVGVAELDDRETWLDAVAGNIAETAGRGDYADAGHFFEHALAGGPELIRRFPPGLLDRFVDRMIGEQQADGGWPTPYDPAWRPWITCQAMTMLALLRDGV